MSNVRTPRFTPAWLSDPTVYSVGEMPIGSDHSFYATNQEADAGVSSLVRSLDGPWRAHFAMTPADAPDALLTGPSLDETLREISLPCEFQLVAPEWDGPQYVNTQYPWDGREELVPPQVSDTYNPTVTCVRRFTLSLKDMQHRIMLRLDGAEAAVLVYVNGHEVGYAESSFTPSMFNITGYVRVGENRVALRVFKRCSGSWLEDQDFWRYSGIHRSVSLHFWPESHLADIRVRTPLTDNCATAHLEAVLTVAGHTDGQARLTLTDRDGAVLYEATKGLNGLPQVAFESVIPGVRLWSAECPALYDLTVTLTGGTGRVTEVSRTKVGFRQFEMCAVNGQNIMCLNGKRIVFHGVNRHEFDCDHGRVVTEEGIRRDLALCKQMNINAIRTSHYPNTSAFYRLCDEYGFYVIDENNLETHGSWSPMHEWVLPGDREEWLGAVLHRGCTMLERDKNHPCVLMWSCGNESYGGKVIWELSEYFRRADPTRLVHYEGVANDARYPDTTDMYSRMYLRAADIEKYLKGSPKKPFINCEYTHAMGNSCGGMNEYTALEDKYPMYQGGFIWDFVDQGLRTVGPNGEERYAYGGDFGDRPADWQFIGNGIVMADRSLSPKAQEVHYLFRDVFLKPGRTGVTITNRRLFTALDHHSLRWTVEQDMKPVRAGEIPLPEIAPGESRHIDLPYAGKLPAEGQIVLTCYLILNEEEGLLPAGSVISHGQTVLGETARADAENAGPAPIRGDNNVGFRTEKMNVMFERQRTLISMKDRAGREMLLTAPKLSLFRAATDNDDGNGYAIRQGVYHMISRYNTHSGPQISTEPGCTSITWAYTCPGVPSLVIPVTYTMRTEDAVEVTLDWPGAENLPDLPALGVSFQLDPRYSLVNYYGYGPEENYVDRRDGAYLGWHTYPADQGMTRYLNPQESGNRGGVQSLSVTDGDQHGLLIMGNGLEVSVQRWLPEEVAAARHPGDLTGPVKTVVDVALFRKGVGGDDSWGAPTLPRYCYPAGKPYRLTFTLRAL